MKSLGTVKETINMCSLVLKSNIDDFKQQYKSLNRTEKFYLETEIAELLLSLSKICTKTFSRNTNYQKQVQQNNKKLLVEQWSVTRSHNISLSMPIQQSDVESSASSVRRLQRTNNSVKQRLKMNKLRKPENNFANSSIPLTFNNNKKNPKCTTCDQTQAYIQKLQSSLTEMEQFLQQNNQQYVIELQMYNQKIWQIEAELSDKKQACCKMQQQIKELKFLNDKLRVENVKLMANSKTMQDFIKLQDKTHFQTTENSPKQFAKNHIKKVLQARINHSVKQQ